MKKCCALMLMMAFLTGCRSSETFETVADQLIEPVMVQTAEIVVTVPESASSAVMESEDGGRLYLCDGYTMTVQTLTGGDIDRTARALCGYGTDALTVMRTRDGELSRHEWIWVCAGEGGEQLGRAAVLDDGRYHYCLTVMADAADAAALEPEWSAIFETFALNTDR